MPQRLTKSSIYSRSLGLAACASLESKNEVCLLCEVNPKQIPAFDFICASLESILAIEDTWERERSGFAEEKEASCSLSPRRSGKSHQHLLLNMAKDMCLSLNPHLDLASWNVVSDSIINLRRNLGLKILAFLLNCICNHLGHIRLTLFSFHDNPLCNIKWNLFVVLGLNKDKSQFVAVMLNFGDDDDVVEDEGVGSVSVNS
ncbi:hypothetical protein Tco_0290569 [Tanacetum coccineum]